MINWFPGKADTGYGVDDNPEDNLVSIKLRNTQNDLPSKARWEAVDLLNRHLADAIDLAYQAKQAHWNVKGPNFIALHELFDEVVEEIEEYVDEIAERAVELGGTALGTVRVSAGMSRLSEYPLVISSGRAHVKALSGALAKFGKTSRAAIDAAAALGDADTADLFTEVSRGVDKLLWKVEAHGQAKD
jgi:starvation-inducible DNA-binding protein